MGLISTSLPKPWHTLRWFLPVNIIPKLSKSAYIPLPYRTLLYIFCCFFLLVYRLNITKVKLSILLNHTYHFLDLWLQLFTLKAFGNELNLFEGFCQLWEPKNPTRTTKKKITEKHIKFKYVEFISKCRKLSKHST